jgi:DHA1 family bicyclomycin/chloramphenicol resistance-like MFS transporter
VTAVLTGLVAITPLSIDMPLPALPDLARALGADVARAQLVISVFLLGFAGAQLVHGPLSDRFGRRPVLLGGIGLYLGASLVCRWAPSIEWLIAGRLLQGLGACAGPVLARAIVRDVHVGARAARILSFIATGMALAPILAPVLGGVVLLWSDWRGIFAVLAATSVVLLAAVFALVAETNTQPDASALAPGRLAHTFATILGSRVFLGYALTVALGAVGLFAFISGAPFVLIDLMGLAPQRFGVIFGLAVGGGQISGAFLSSRLTVRLGVDRMMAVGTGLYVLGGLAMAALAWAGATWPAAVVAPMTVFMVGNGLVMPNGMAGAIIPFPRTAGTASALSGFLQMGAGALGGIAVGHLHDGTARPMATLIAAAGVGAFVLFRLLIPRPSRRGAAQNPGGSGPPVG